MCTVNDIRHYILETSFNLFFQSPVLMNAL